MSRFNINRERSCSRHLQNNIRQPLRLVDHHVVPVLSLTKVFQLASALHSASALSNAACGYFGARCHSVHIGHSILPIFYFCEVVTSSIAAL